MFMEKIIKIEGMHCKSCKSLIEGEVSEIECVDSIAVSLEDANARIILKEDCTEQIVSTINELGFSAKVQ
jgi:copper chaperone CopZ